MRHPSKTSHLSGHGKQDAQVQGVTRLDRETLERVMRDDVFLAADGKALALRGPEMWTQARRDTRRA